MRKYYFKAKDIPLVTKEIIDSWERLDGDIKTTLSLGIDYENIEKKGDNIWIRGYKYSYNKLRKINKGFIYALDKGSIYPLSFFKDGLFYKLYPIAFNKAPTLEISGIKMHRVVNIDPWTDAQKKVELLRIRKVEKVLDICTGLGYTAIHAYNYSPDVITIEIDKNVLDMATYNPWSKGLENIDIVLGDAFEIIKLMEESSFDVIIHDPPRFSRAGQLYSLDFYKELYRILRPCGRLFHYTGKVGYKRRGINIMGGVSSRLKRIGFITTIKKELHGVYAKKPC